MARVDDVPAEFIYQRGVVPSPMPLVITRFR